MATQTPAKQLFDLLVTRDFDLELLDSSGKPALDPSAAEIFSFDFVAQSSKNYGTVVIMLGDNNSVEMFFGDNVGKTMEGSDKSEWYDFMGHIKNFGTKNFLNFSSNNINRLRYSMQGQAAIKEGLFESWRGTKTTSYNDKPEHVRLMIRHKKPISEGDARYRYIESLYVETTDGERFKLPFTKLAGGRAMVEHVRNGGKPYDARGQHIVSVVEELNVLSRFRRANYGQVFEGATAELIAETNSYYENLNRVLKGLGTQRGYSNYFETWNPAEITEQDVVIEGIKNLFVRETIDTRIEQALPVLARIQQQGQAMKESHIFEAWANRLAEGTWSTPDTPEKQTQLVELLSTEFPVGADATNATEQLYDLIGDDQLFDQLETLADQNADADARQTVYNRLVELSDDPSIAEVLNQLNIDTDTPAEQEDPADEVSEDQDESSPVESAILRRIMNSHLDLLKQYGPAAVMAAARDVAEYIGNVEEIGSSDVSAYVKQVVQSLDHGDHADLAKQVNEEQLDEILPALGAIVGGAARIGAGALGAMGRAAVTATGRSVGDALGDAFSDDDDEDEVDEAVDPANPRDYEIPAYLRKQQGQAPLTPGDVKAKDQKAQTDFQKRVGNLEEGRCNMTAEGTECPKHGISECWTQSAQDNGDTDTLARLKTLSGITNR